MTFSKPNLVTMDKNGLKADSRVLVTGTLAYQHLAPFVMFGKINDATFCFDMRGKAIVSLS